MSPYGEHCNCSGLWCAWPYRRTLSQTANLQAVECWHPVQRKLADLSTGLCGVSSTPWHSRCRRLLGLPTTSARTCLSFGTQLAFDNIVTHTKHRTVQVHHTFSDVAAAVVVQTRYRRCTASCQQHNLALPTSPRSQCLLVDGTIAT